MSEHEIWVVKGPDGILRFWTARESKTQSINAFCLGGVDSVTEKKARAYWKRMQEQGYRCVPMLAVERVG